MTVNPSIGYLEGIRLGVIEMKWWLGRKCLINLSFGLIIGKSIGCTFGIRRYVRLVSSLLGWLTHKAKDRILKIRTMITLYGYDLRQDYDNSLRMATTAFLNALERVADVRQTLYDPIVGPSPKTP
ncbi:hypothetical protein V1478_010147 [Vespula squamosa]|uniref:Uncharacterized protein n=1 Tax=Vespula squamosa TaxID=30214 RepID=A0ABD2AIW8_VESSQ